ncbi:PTS sugar transporter subunit IIC [Enterococcus sp. 2201sp1_2201st1_B8_2201SCRN_220225]|uniref:PTS sugar transporter subunit IIC n=1 Tax=unclassified Enterococcus TaxID=2608891 RepID=UPI0034A54D8F
MNKFVEFVDQKVSPPLMKLGENRYMVAVKNGMILTVPFTIIGSIFMVLAQFPAEGYQSFIEPYKNVLMVPTSVTFNILGLIAVVGISYSLAKVYQIDSIRSVLMSLVCFLLVQTGLNEEGVYILNTGNFGTLGVFAAIIVSFIVVELYRFCLKRNLSIRMPETVPPAIAKSFEILMPLLLSISLFWVIRILLNFDINAALNALFSPLVMGLNTLPGIILFMFLRSLLWCVGIHGGAVLSVADPIFLTMLGANAEAFATGQPAPYITAAGFVNFIFIGGGGATMMLVIFMMFSKEKGLRTLGRLSFPSSLFEINEPIVFGAPVVLNPVLMIPYTLCNCLLAIIAYLLMHFNLIGRPVATVPWTTPPILMQYLTAGGDWRAAVYGVFALVLTGAIYYPFFKMLEKQRLEIAELEEKSELTAVEVVSEVEVR